MFPELVVIGDDTSVNAQRRTLAERVVAAFPGGLPEQRLLCYFDEHDSLLIKEYVGAANRGLYMPVVNGPLWARLPDPVRDYVVFGNRSAISEFPPKRIRRFDQLIYLHGSSCTNEIGMTMTFTHELQHFVQHESALVLWQANTLAAQMLCNLDRAAVVAMGLQWCDIPIEREARIIAKRIAEHLFGADAVGLYIRAKHDELVTDQDAADWKCIEALDSAYPYDLASETRRFFPRLKDYWPQLKTALQELEKQESGFADLDLDTLLCGDRG